MIVITVNVIHLKRFSLEIDFFFNLDKWITFYVVKLFIQFTRLLYNSNLLANCKLRLVTSINLARIKLLKILLSHKLEIYLMFFIKRVSPQATRF
jgi:hypothetical protein